jgi:hypothetical protein
MACSSFLFFIIIIAHALLSPSYGLKPFWSMGHYLCNILVDIIVTFRILHKVVWNPPQILLQLVFFFSCNEILPNFYLKRYDFNLFKGYLMKKIAQIQQISKKKIQITKFLWEVPIGCEKYRRILVFLYFHI